MDDRTKRWSSVGSAGTVDVADLGKVTFHNSIVQLGMAGPSTSFPSPAVEARVVAGYQEQAAVRYNVTPVDGLFPTDDSSPLGPVYELVLRYRVGDGRIVANLMQVEIDTGVESRLLNWDSQTAIFLQEGPDWHTSELGGNTYIGSLDFVHNSYYIELVLSALESAVRPLTYPPAVSVIQLVDGTSFLPADVRGIADRQ